MKENSSSARDYSLDNIRSVLMFLVVFAHLLEVCAPFAGSGKIYKFIYSFHMPAFLFLFGYNVRYSPKRILFRWCIPYVIFQCIYIIFVKAVLNVNIGFRFTTPYWLLWYLLVCIYYQLLLPLFDTGDKYKQIVTLLCVFILSLLIGYNDSIGYKMSLSRFLVFQPWFVLGYYCKKNDALRRLSAKSQKRRGTLAVSAAAILILMPFVSTLPNGLLYGSYSYSNCGGTVWMRVLVSVMSLSMILFLFVGMKPYFSKQTLITNIGQNTWPTFLLHGFVVKAAPVYFPCLIASPMWVILLSCGILVFTGNRVCNRVVWFVSLSGLEHLGKKSAEKESIR